MELDIDSYWGAQTLLNKHPSISSVHRLYIEIVNSNRDNNGARN